MDVDGYILVWHPLIVRKFRRSWMDELPDDWEAILSAGLKKADLGHEFGFAVICNCDSRVAAAKRTVPVEQRRYIPDVYDPQRMSAYLDGDPKKLTEWIESHPLGAAWEPAGSYGEF